MLGRTAARSASKSAAPRMASTPPAGRCAVLLAMAAACSAERRSWRSSSTLPVPSQPSGTSDSQALTWANRLPSGRSHTNEGEKPTPSMATSSTVSRRPPASTVMRSRRRADAFPAGSSARLLPGARRRARASIAVSSGAPNMLR